MSRQPRVRATKLWLRSMQHLRKLGKKLKQRLLQRELKRAQSRLEALQAETRHQLLKLKELEQNLQQVTHRLQELSPEQQEPEIPGMRPLGIRGLLQEQRERELLYLPPFPPEDPMLRP